MGLIHKNRNKSKDTLQRIEVQAPTNIVSRNDFFKSNKVKKQTTTIRCNIDIADKINSLTVLLDYDSVNALLDSLIYKEISTLDENKKAEFRNIENVYKQKRKLKGKK